MRIQGASTVKHNEDLITYYELADRAYRNWTQLPEGSNIPYSLHSGFHPEGVELDQYESISLMNSKIIDLMDIPEQKEVNILDAGCGVGSIAFEIARMNSNAGILGINLMPTQIKFAEEFRLAAKLDNISYILADFKDLPVLDGVFDRVLFCESLSHSEDQKATLIEASRILKRNGRVVICEALLVDWDLDEELACLLADLSKGWFMPEFRTVREFEQLLLSAGFSKILLFKDITNNTLPSARRIGLHSEKSILSTQDTPQIIIESRKASIALYKLMKVGKLRYNWIVAEK